jgi:hypothetical protein
VKQFNALSKKIQIRQILTVFLAGLLLFFSTACNSGDVRGARPDNLPVQAGANNNPYKAGGDGYTNYKASTDPKVNQSTSNSQGNRADLQLVSHQLIAASQGSDIIYSGSNTNDKQLPEVVSGEREVLKDANKIPAERQPVFKRTDPDANILERVGEAFKDASAFIKDKADEAGARPEAQSNPALHD